MLTGRTWGAYFSCHDAGHQGGGLPRCRALHFDEAKRVRDVSLMTQT